MTKFITKFFLLLLISIGSVYLSSPGKQLNLPANISTPASDKSGFTDLAVFKKAYESQQSNLQVKQSGRVVKILKDDRYGPQHQRFLVQLDSGPPLLIAHNIDLASKIENLKVGDQITFYGEYEWNNKGGVIHWTHRDPKGRHPNGWLLHENIKYE